jgi:hypothetical protein
MEPTSSSLLDSSCSYDSWDEDSDDILEFDNDGGESDLTESSNIAATNGALPPEAINHSSGNEYDEKEMDLDLDYDSDDGIESEDNLIPASHNIYTNRNPLDLDTLRAIAIFAAKKGTDASSSSASPITAASTASLVTDTCTSQRLMPRRNPKQSLSDDEIKEVALRMLKFKATDGAVQEPKFDIISALTTHPEVVEMVAAWLDPDSLCNLYSISRPFHYLMNTRYHYYIKGSASIWAPFGRIVFPFHAFRNLCIEDPGSRPVPYQRSQTRHIPSLKYLKMIVSRQTIVDEILAALDQSGHRLPRDAHITLQKIWLTMSIPGNGARIGLLHNHNYWTDEDLYLATQFSLKLDMHCTDPVDGSGEHVIRDVFLGKRSLVPLHKLLHGQYTPLQLVQHFVAFDYRIPAQHANLSVFGIPASLVGRGCVEGWGAGTERALGVCEGVMLEAMRRGLKMNRYYLDMMLFGYSDITDNVSFELASKEPREFKEKEKLVDWRLRTYGIQSV